MRAIVLGSGLNHFSDYFEIIKSISFESVLDVTFETLEGHERKFIWCRHETEVFVIISGKFHYYEGHAFKDLIAPLKYAINELGVNEIMVTSASGGLSNRIEVGEWTYINQIICLPEIDMNVRGAMNIKDTSVEKENGDTFFDSLQNGVYTYHQGPSLGSLAEYKMLNLLGADLVGMSMLPEFCYLKSTDIQAHFLSIPVCNYFPFENVEEPSFEDVLKISSIAVPVLAEIFISYITNRKLA